jgi:hypothetical protein
MTTLSDIEARGEMLKFRGDLEADEMPERMLWYTSECDQWLRGPLSAEPKPPRRKLYPSDEVWNIFVAFIMGRPMAYDVELKKLDPLPLHVWANLSTHLSWFDRLARACPWCCAAWRDVILFVTFSGGGCHEWIFR